MARIWRLYGMFLFFFRASEKKLLLPGKNRSSIETVPFTNPETHRMGGKAKMAALTHEERAALGRKGGLNKARNLRKAAREAQKAGRKAA